MFDFLCAQIKQKEIAEIVGINLSTVWHLKQAKNAGKGTKRTPGSGEHNKKRSEELLKTVQTQVYLDPNLSIRKLSAEMEVDPKTMRTALH